MFVSTSMLQLFITIWLHGHVVGMLSEGPFSTANDSCEKRGKLIADTLIKLRYPRFNGKIKIKLECFQGTSTIT